MNIKEKQSIIMKDITLFILLTLILCSCDQKPTPADPSSNIQPFTNPLLSAGADPWVVQHDGLYYYCFSKDGGIQIKVVRDITDLAEAETIRAWTPPPNTRYSKELWAPELHRIADRWYIYVAADDGDNANHRMHVLASKDGTVNSGFEYVGKISDPTDKWAIDGTVLHYRNRMYFIWSGWEGDVNEAQHLYIAEMDSPTSISSERVLLSSPDYDWEKAGSGNGLPTINEGPQILQKEGSVYIVYSAAGSWSDHYCLGMLSLEGDDPMQKKSWQKSPEPVFAGTEQVISPGHCSFITIGDQDWIVYHATRFKGGGWQNRYVKMQPFDWSEEGPVFGAPVPDGVVLEMHR